jgi:hypothetical protein
MTRLGLQLTRWREATSVVVAAALLLYAVSAGHESGAPGEIKGNYKVQVAGYGKGKGTCVVSAKGVSVDCTIRDPNGDEQVLTGSDLKLEGNRFRGDGTLDGVKCRISGRVEQPTATTKTPRFLATFVSGDGRGGRLVGTRD